MAGEIAHIMRTPQHRGTRTYFDFTRGQEVVEDLILDGISWCGRLVAGWFFVDAEHAKAGLDGSVQVCKRCWRAAVRAGAVTPPKHLEIDTWARHG